MNIEELKDLKAQLESDLHTAVSKLLEQFEKDTGLTPSSVDVQMVEVTSLEDRERRYMPSWVRCDISI